MLKLYIGMLVFGVVFSCKNVSYNSFSQNIVKAMESSRPGGKGLVNISEFSVELNCFVSHYGICNVYDEVKKLKLENDNLLFSNNSKQLKNEPYKYKKEQLEKESELYKRFCDVIKEIANLEKDNSNVNTGKHIVSEFIEEYNNMRHILLGKETDKSKEIGECEKTKIKNFFTESYKKLRNVGGFLKRLKCLREDINKTPLTKSLSNVGGFLERLKCFREDIDKTPLTKSLFYVTEYTHACFCKIEGILESIYKLFDFVDFAEYGAKVEGEQVCGSKTIQSDAGFFKHELSEPDSYFTGLDEEYLVSREDLFEVYKKVKGRHDDLKEIAKKYRDLDGRSEYAEYRKIRCEFEAYNKIEETLSLDEEETLSLDEERNSEKCVENRFSGVISKFKKRYNSMLAVLRKSKDELTDKEREDVKSLFEEVSDLSGYFLSKFACFVSWLGLEDGYYYSDGKSPQYGKDYYLAERCSINNRYLHYWFLTFNKIRSAIDEKFIHNDKDYEEANDILKYPPLQYSKRKYD